jgi:hypothetical protein
MPSYQPPESFASLPPWLQSIVAAVSVNPVGTNVGAWPKVGSRSITELLGEVLEPTANPAGRGKGSSVGRVRVTSLAPKGKATLHDVSSGQPLEATTDQLAGLLRSGTLAKEDPMGVSSANLPQLVARLRALLAK